MNAAAIAEHLRSSFNFPLLALGDGRTHAVELAPQRRIELCLVARAQTLCMAAPVGMLLMSQCAEGLERLLQANLYLADAGQPHYALGPHDDSVFLCRSFEPLDQDQLAWEVRRFLDLAVQAQEALHAQPLAC